MAHSDLEHAQARIAAARQRAAEIAGAEKLSASNSTSIDAESVGNGGRYSTPEGSRAAGFASTLRVRCPHCQQTVEVADDTSWSQIACGACGSTFSLVGERLGWAVPGARLGRFELLSVVGEGAFGAVWRARDTQLDREVAIKFPRRGELDPLETELFLREARATAQLRHPNIVSLLEVGREGATLYLVYDLVRGPSLAERMRQRLSIDEAVELCRKIAEALDYAHGLGIVHRDLKPANILLDAGGEPRLADFGLAKRETGEVTMTVDGQLVGTPAYMSPEQARGQSHEADGRADIYSLGVVLYEMFTGEVPFRGTPRMIVEQTVRDDPPSPRRLNPQVSRDLETICLKCLEKQPALRYATAGDLAADLQRFRQRRPVLARPAGPIRKLTRSYRRHPFTANALLATAALAIVGPALALHEARLAERESQARVRESQARVRETRARERGDRYLYVARMNNVEVACESGDFRRAAQLLDQERPAPGEPDLRGFEWFYWWHECHRGLVAQVTTNQRLLALTVSPDGKSLAFGGDDGRLLVADRATLEVRHALVGHQGILYSAAYSSDGRWIATGGQDATVRLWDADEAICLATCQLLPEGVRGVAISDDRTKLAAALLDGTARVWTIACESNLPKLIPATPFVLDGRAATAPEALGYCVAWSRNASHLALGVGGASNWGAGEMQWWNAIEGRCLARVASERPCDFLARAADRDLFAIRTQRGSFDLWDAESQSTTTTLACPAGEVFSPAFSAEGRRLYASNDRGTLWCWDVESRQIVERWPGHENIVHGLAKLPGDSAEANLVSIGLDGKLRVWKSIATSCEAPTPCHEQWIGQMAVDRPNANVVSTSADGRSRVWDAHTGALLQEMVGATGTSAAAISPDGRHLALRQTPDTVGVYDLETRQVAATLGPLREPIYCIAISPDGRMLAAGGGNSKAPWPGEPTDLGVWDMANGNRKFELEGNRRLIRAMAFSPDGNTLATGGFDRRVLLWDMSKGTVRGAIEPGGVYNVVCLAFSPDGKTLAFSTHDGSLWLADALRLDEPLRQFAGQDGSIWAIAYMPDGKTIAAAIGQGEPSAAETGTIGLWDTATGEVKTRLATASTHPTALAFTHNGELLAVGNRDGSVRLFRAPRSEFLSRALGPTR